MLDAFIIEELRRREKQERSHSEAPRIELPLEEPHRYPHPPKSDADNHDPYAPQRGVVVIDL